MAVEILRPAPESAGARRASAIVGAELVSPVESIKVPDPEVRDKAVRRRFTAKYKLSILQRADACKDSGGGVKRFV
jgi:transposase